MNFRYRLLNVQKLDINEEAKGLTYQLILFIFKNIWDLDKDKARELLKLGGKLSEKEWKYIVSNVALYVKLYDPDFSWKVLKKVGKEVNADLKILPAWLNNLSWESAQNKEGENFKTEKHFKNIMIHELGHALGITHLPPDETNLMQSQGFGCDYERKVCSFTLADFDSFLGIYDFFGAMTRKEQKRRAEERRRRLSLQKELECIRQGGMPIKDVWGRNTGQWQFCP